MSACLHPQSSFDAEGEVGLKVIPRGKSIVGSFEIGLDEFEKAWTGLFLWMNEMGYSKATREPFEIYHNDPREHPEGKAVVDLCIPIQ